MTPNEAISVLELNQRVSNAVAIATDIQNIWVKGETSDLRESGGHCYLELVQKDDNGKNVSRIRANIWYSTWRTISRTFEAQTGSKLVSGMKVCVKVTTGYHPAYGMSVTITEIDASYTLGDAVRRRNEIIARLTREGIIENNRNLRWPFAPQRVAVISARGAAGFGDFVNQLLSTPSRLRFDVRLFPALMQGNETVPSVLGALSQIRASIDNYDVVVIIRGGGSTSDLAAFDSYELATAVATMPIPVIVGIGHERDVTVLDFVGHRVKTPTAAAELLITRVKSLLDGLGRFAEQMYRAANLQIASNREFLAHVSASVPGIIQTALIREHSRIDRLSLSLAGLSETVITPRLENLRRMTADIEAAITNRLKFCQNNLSYYSEMVRVLSPEAVLSRGFSITTDGDGKAVTDSASIVPGTVLTTRLKKGSIKSQTL